MTCYVVIRHGCNAANQHMTPRLVLGLVEAPSPAKALEKAAEQWTCYVNQRFEVIPWGKAPRADRRAADEAVLAAKYEE